jgi:hypothetical protein
MYRYKRCKFNKYVSDFLALVEPTRAVTKTGNLSITVYLDGGSHGSLFKEDTKDTKDMHRCLGQIDTVIEDTGAKRLMKLMPVPDSGTAGLHGGSFPGAHAEMLLHVFFRQPDFPLVRRFWFVWVQAQISATKSGAESIEVADFLKGFTERAVVPIFLDHGGPSPSW